MRTVSRSHELDVDCDCFALHWYVCPIDGRVILTGGGESSDSDVFAPLHFEPCACVFLVPYSIHLAGGLITTAVMKFADNLLKGFAMAGKTSKSEHCDCEFTSDFQVCNAVVDNTILTYSIPCLA